MKQDRITRGVISDTYDRIKDVPDIRITKRSKEDVSVVIEQIVDFQLAALKQDMLNGDKRVIIPKIGKFTYNENKEIIKRIRHNVCKEFGFDRFNDLPDEMKADAKNRVNELSLIEFSKRKRIREQETLKTIAKLRKDLNL